MERNEIITELVKKGCTITKGLIIKSVQPTDMTTWNRLGITLQQNIPAFVPKVDEDGATNYVLGENNIIFVSAFSISALMKDVEDYAYAANYVAQHPNVCRTLLSYATISVLQETVDYKDEPFEYKNPFSSDPKPTIFTHKAIINHVIDIKMGKLGLKTLESIFDKIVADE